MRNSLSSLSKSNEHRKQRNRRPILSDQIKLSRQTILPLSHPPVTINPIVLAVLKNLNTNPVLISVSSSISNQIVIKQNKHQCMFLLVHLVFLMIYQKLILHHRFYLILMILSYSL